MASQSSTATRAVQFMRQCRVHPHAPRSNLPRTFSRSVSSSHLAPSNFSKQTRRRDTDIEHHRLTNLPARHNLPPKPRPLTQSLLNQNTNIPPGFISFVKHRILNVTPPPPEPHKPPPFNVLNNPWRAKKSWPPDFDAMHPKQQFHFEKTFRRRMVLKTNSKRYNWNRYIRLLQQSLILLTVIYFIFIADPYAKDGGGTPVDGFRAWFFDRISQIEHLPEGLKEQARELNVYYGKNWKKAPWNGEDDASPVGKGDMIVEGKTEAV